MFGFLSRILRVLWRQDTEGSQASAVILPFQHPTDVADAAAQVVAASGAMAPVAFIRQTADIQAAPTRPTSLHLASRLQSVQRLNPPVSRSRKKTNVSPAGKPKPLSAAPVTRPSRPVKPGIVLDRLERPSRRSSAEIISLTDVRRVRQVEATDQEIAALFN